MLATQHNHRVESGEINEFAFLQVREFMKNMIQGRPLIILLGFECLNNPGVKIGEPEDVGLGANGGTGTGTGNSGAPQQGGVQQPVRANTFVKPEQGAGMNNNNSNNNHSSNPYSNNNSNNQYGGSSSNAPIMRTMTPSSSKPITPIAQLNMYQNRWTIKARVTSKAEIRHWSNSKGEGKLFSIELLDSTSDIRCTFFKEAVDKFYPMLETDSVYTFSGGRLKAANMQYNTCKSSFEITFDQNTEVCKVDDTGEILQQSYNLVPIASLENTEPGGFVDVLGVVKSVSEPATIMSKKTGKELKKCEVTIGDESGADVSVTIWGERAMEATNEFAGNPIVAFRRCRLSDYGGRSLSANTEGINPNPRIPEAQRLQQWWNSGGSSAGASKSLSSAVGSGGAGRFPIFEERKTISAIKGENLGYSTDNKPDWVSFKGTFSFIKSDKEGGAWYPACQNPDDPCKQRCKVTQHADGTYFCERCQRNWETPLHRYIFSATISDDTSTSWVSLFDDQAKTLLDGLSADQLHEILNGENGQSEYDGNFAKATFTDWIFTCKVKQETHQDETRVKTSIQSLHPVDYAKEGRSLLNSIISM